MPVAHNINTELFENSYSLIDRVMSENVKMINDQYDKAIVKALRSVGYEFSDKNKLVDFIKTRCTVTDSNVPTDTRVFLIDNKAVFKLHKYIYHNYSGSNAEMSCEIKIEYCS